MSTPLAELLEQMDAQLEAQSRQALDWQRALSPPAYAYRRPSRREKLLYLLDSPLATVLPFVLLIGALTALAADGHGWDYLWIELAVLFVAFVQTPLLLRLLGR